MKRTASNNQGFAAVEAVLIIIILAIIGFTGYYVWHSKQITDTTLNTTASTAADTNAEDNNTQTQPPASFTYYDCLDKYDGIANGKDGLACSYQGKTFQLPDTYSSAMIRNSQALPASAKSTVDTIARTLYKEESAPSADVREPAEVIVVSVDDTKFIKLNEYTATGSAEILYDNSGTWQSIFKANEHGIKCATVQQYKIPLSLLESGKGVTSIKTCDDTAGVAQPITKYAN